MSITPSPCSFLFALHLEWSLDINTDQKSNAICILANLCSTLLVCGSNFLKLDSTFGRNAQKKEEKMYIYIDSSSKM